MQACGIWNLELSSTCPLTYEQIEPQTLALPSETDRCRHSRTKREGVWSTRRYFIVALKNLDYGSSGKKSPVEFDLIDVHVHHEFPARHDWNTNLDGGR